VAARNPGIGDADELRVEVEISTDQVSKVLPL
jgi:hypothetical protein